MKREGFEVEVPVGVKKLLGDLRKPAAQKQAHFISLLTHRIVANYPDGDWRLPKQISRKYFCHHYTTNYSKTVIEPLIASGCVTKYDKFSVGRFAKSYGLSDELRQEVLAGRTTNVLLRKNTLIRAILNWRHESQQRQFAKYSFLVDEAKMLLNLNIDEDILSSELKKRIRKIRASSKYKDKGLVIKQAIAAMQRLLQMSNASSIDEVRIRYVSGRVYHPLVNCPKEFRKAVVDDENCSWVEVDLRSSQAVFLCKLIGMALTKGLYICLPKTNEFQLREPNKLEGYLSLQNRRYNTEPFPDDFIQFYTDVFYGDIYKIASKKGLLEAGRVNVYSEGGIAYPFPTEIEGYRQSRRQRDRDKRSFFKDIFFNKYKSENSRSKKMSSEYVGLFKNRYPSVFHFCRELARLSPHPEKKSRELALLLQRTESNFFHLQVSQEFLMRFGIPHYVVHDAIYLPKESLKEAYGPIIAASQIYFGAIPRFTPPPDIATSPNTDS